MAKKPDNFIEPNTFKPRTFIEKTADGLVLQHTVKPVTLADRKAMSPERAAQFKANMQRQIDQLKLMGASEDDPVIASMRYLMDPT